MLNFYMELVFGFLGFMISNIIKINSYLILLKKTIHDIKNDEFMDF